MNEVLTMFIVPVFAATMVGVMLSIYFLFKDGKAITIQKKKIKSRSDYVDSQIKRVELLSKQFDLRTPRFVVLKPFDANDNEYRRSLRDIVESESFRWFMYQLREKMIEQIKAADVSNSQLLVSYSAYITAIDEIVNAMTAYSRELIDLEQGELSEDEPL